MGYPLQRRHEEVGISQGIELEFVPETGVQSGQHLVEDVEAGFPFGAPHHPRLLKQHHLSSKTTPYFIKYNFIFFFFKAKSIISGCWYYIKCKTDLPNMIQEGLCQNGKVFRYCNVKINEINIR